MMGRGLNLFVISLAVLQPAFGAEPQSPPPSCENIRVRGQGVRQTVDRVKQRAQQLCGQDGNGGQIAEAGRRVAAQLDRCVDKDDPEYSTSLTSAFDANQRQRARELCSNLRKDLDRVDQFCQKQGRVRATGEGTVQATAAGDSGSRPGTGQAGQQELFRRLAGAHQVKRDFAQRFQTDTAALREELAKRRRQGDQSNANAAHSEDALMRRQEQFFLQAPQRRAQLFTERAGKETDPARKRRLLDAAKACREAASPNSPAVQFRKAMENHLLPNHENLYKMSEGLDQQARSDVEKANAELAEAERKRVSMRTDGADLARAGETKTEAERLRAEHEERQRRAEELRAKASLTPEERRELSDARGTRGNAALRRAAALSAAETEARVYSPAAVAEAQRASPFPQGMTAEQRSGLSYREVRDSAWGQGWIKEHYVKTPGSEVSWGADRFAQYCYRPDPKAAVRCHWYRQ